MSAPTPSFGKLVWQELLSSEEIAEWAKSRKQPRKLWRVGDVSRPGVYRFIFPDDRSCYIGVAGHFGRRLRDHICIKVGQESDGSAKLESGWSVRGAIRNSIGKCYLQYLTIEGTVNMCGVELNQHSFDDLFARLLLENWAILHSERIDKLRPRNRDIPTGIQQGTKDFLRMAKGNIAKAGRNGAVINRGGLESFFDRAR
jgi:hypothetical protein